MMPAKFVAQPADPTLARCIKRYRASRSKNAWRVFRANEECGGRALGHLRDAYGHRCLYCDHSDGWTIDHVKAKASRAAGTFAWANWRPSCLDCNNRKGTKRIVDPVREDPRSYISFDVVTGEPLASSQRHSKAVADATCATLENQTLNEARRATRARMVELLEQVVAGTKGSKASVSRMLARETPHRGILRDLILETDDALNPFCRTVAAALKSMPELASWAAKPLG